MIGVFLGSGNSNNSSKVGVCISNSNNSSSNATSYITTHLCLFSGFIYTLPLGKINESV